MTTNLITATLALCTEYGVILAAAFWKKANATLESLFVKQDATNEEWDAALFEAVSRAQTPSNWQTVADYVSANYTVLGLMSRGKFFGLCQYDVLTNFVAGEGKLLQATLLSLTANDAKPLDSGDIDHIHLCLSGLTALAERDAAWVEPLINTSAILSGFIELRGGDEDRIRGLHNRRDGIINRFKAKTVSTTETTTGLAKTALAPRNKVGTPQKTKHIASLPVRGNQLAMAMKKAAVVN